ncbi:MAG: zinc ribbon domain-containing protein [Clostridia bacterium]|nr:zinc ribbon domain-containing protein [Clostridia bacterium]
MDFWNKLTKKASETYKGASEKTNKIARETKLKLKINDNKSKINDLYEEIGKKVYQKHVANQELINVKEDIGEECAKIDSLGNEIEEYEKEIWDLKDNKQCPKCKSKINKDDAFCPNCGEKQEEEIVCEVELVEDDATVNEEVNYTDQTEKQDPVGASGMEEVTGTVESQVVEEVKEEDKKDE